LITLTAMHKTFNTNSSVVGRKRLGQDVAIF